VVETVAKEGAWPETAGQSAPEVIQGEIDCGRDSEREERREGGREQESGRMRMSEGDGETTSGAIDTAPQVSLIYHSQLPEVNTG